MVFLWFADAPQADENERLDRDVFGDKEIRERLAACVPTRLPLNAEFEAAPAGDAAGDAPRQVVRLLEHEAFAELLGKPGVALIDMRDPASPHFHRVVSVFPFSPGPISAGQLKALLDLPEGSLTQRTLIWAVRTHGDRPQSASANASSLLMEEAASHSHHQASINLQGHHQWERRFNSINAQLPADLVAQEICSESWPGQPLVAAAQECVHSWRQSPGHWNAVRSRHLLFGYDMQRGANGVWYATGIFGRRR